MCSAAKTLDPTSRMGMGQCDIGMGMNRLNECVIVQVLVDQVAGRTWTGGSILLYSGGRQFHLLSK